MAQTKRKRRRKHRGTPAGTIDRAARTGARHAPRSDPKATARQRRAERMDREPTWRGAVNRAAIAAVVFGVLLILVFGRPLDQAVPLLAFMFVFYIPLGYATDRAIYRFRRRRRG